MISDFNMIPENKKLSDFCEMNKFECLILKRTFYKGLLPYTIDFLLSNHKQSLMRSDVYETGISGNHKMIILLLRKTFAEGKSKTVSYRCYKHFDQDSFNETLKNRISSSTLSFEKFMGVFQSTLDSFAPYKQKRLWYLK